MGNLAVHRLVEQHAATRGEMPAIIHDAHVLSYRDLNHAANALARGLMDRGFRRGGHALVNIDGPELGIVLLAVLKAGGSYTWIAPTAVPWRLAIAPEPKPDQRDAYVPVDVEALLRQPIRPNPNLPVLTRPSDIACILDARDGRGVHVPHATLLALCPDAAAGVRVWDGDDTTFGLWSALLAGATLDMTPAPAWLKAA